MKSLKFVLASAVLIAPLHAAAQAYPAQVIRLICPYAAGGPVINLRELIAYARQRPGLINCASSGVATGSHLGGELFNTLAGTKMVHIPYKGAGPATITLLAREIDVGFMNVTPQLPHIRAQKLRAIAITGSTRTSALRDVPTAAEAGMPGLLAESWTGFFAPAGTPPTAIMTFYNALAKVMLRPETKARLATMGADVMLQNPEELAAYVVADRKRLLSILKSINLKQN
ncbi:MAG: hypothetical protein A3H35_18665 [Betaproteobacteria bacterium RIFCSPLOWO2_02_FULL_62_17]|nr:MAG: hypothetical protein A3H35_18665 [Betaproteobacteria bacterium RIFCSPLOWO2_02_FULL_62_17]